MDGLFRWTTSNYQYYCYKRGKKGSVALCGKKILSKQKAIVMKSVVPTGAGDLFTAGFMYGLGSWKPLTLRNNAEKNNDQWTIEGIEDRNEMDGGFCWQVPLL
ncbi:hypothetical protein FRACYDRAFT_236598 [Fragilariopsis cylindrus CCMP1102]|uniref:Carbohydrate kinase PfkB domain-containing protein n=1 Tax=Fragilariopsis cylindrus CCMP1102 TaxID=635003 RepID=A0A1E7FJG9_9STRA|nr:hypothetical protein FRACYDRAFT_236598 [Fragilariopsis cylindrus CCMP1102]|eukprot:OEU18321.1 hypothetical protein FRACYDRAFT_236598 [Fragilariopsis cylindrus CCMP1102]